MRPWHLGQTRSAVVDIDGRLLVGRVGRSGAGFSRRPPRTAGSPRAGGWRGAAPGAGPTRCRAAAPAGPAPSRPPRPAPPPGPGGSRRPGAAPPPPTGVVVVVVVGLPAQPAQPLSGLAAQLLDRVGPAPQALEQHQPPVGGDPPPGGQGGRRVGQG